MSEERLISEDGRLVKQGIIGMITLGALALAADLTLNRRGHDIADSVKKKQWGRLGKNVVGAGLNTIPVSLLKYLKFFKQAKHAKGAARALNAWEGTAGAGSAAGLTAWGASKRAQHNYEKGKEPGLSEKAIAPLATASSWLLKADPGYLYDTGLGPVKGMDSVNERERFKNLRSWMQDQEFNKLYDWGEQGARTGRYSKDIPGHLRTTWKRNPEVANSIANAVLTRKQNEAILQDRAARKGASSGRMTSTGRGLDSLRGPQQNTSVETSQQSRSGSNNTRGGYRSSPAFPSPRRSLHNRYMT